MYGRTADYIKTLMHAEALVKIRLKADVMAYIATSLHIKVGS